MRGIDPDGPLWVTLYQKAYLRLWNVDTKTYTSPFGDLWQSAANALYALTGVHAASTSMSRPLRGAAGKAAAALGAAKLSASGQSAFKKGANIIVTTLGDDRVPGDSDLVPNHTYAVVRVSRAGAVLHNPLGINDGRAFKQADGTVSHAHDGNNDGEIAVSWSRLFSSGFFGRAFIASAPKAVNWG